MVNPPASVLPACQQAGWRVGPVDKIANKGRKRASGAKAQQGVAVTAVVLVGDLPGTGVIQASMAVRATVPGSADHPAFIDLMAHAVRERSAVLVLCPAWQSAEAGKAVRLARGALDCDRIAFLPLNLPPLAMSLVADQVAFASSY